MTTNPLYTIRMTMAGPSRVGKTSIITSILSQAEDLLSGKPVMIEPANSATENRIDANANELRAVLNSPNDDFNVATLPGTQSPTEFNLRMKFGSSEIKFDILDVPGGWLNPHNRDPSGWEDYKQWLFDSPVLIIPVDATLVMEGRNTEREKATSLKNLEVESLTELVHEWAKARKDEDVPSLLIIAPVKCESYFNDNPVKVGGKDLSDEMYDRVRLIYQDVLAGSLAINRNMITEYHPIDTLGVVDFVSGFYDERNSFQAKYRRKADANRLNPFGAEGILTSISRLVVESRKTKVGFWRRIIDRITGEGQQLETIFLELSNTTPGPRVKTL